MRSSVLGLVLVALSLVVSPALAQKNCSKGKPCGNTCISMSYTCHIGGGSAGSSSGSDYNSGYGTGNDYNDDDYDEYDYNDYYSTPTDSTLSMTSGGSSMSGGALVVNPYMPPEPSGEIVDFYTGLPTSQARSHVRGVLKAGSFTEDGNIVYADDLTVEFSENSIGMAVLRMQGTNKRLMDKISAAFY